MSKLPESEETKEKHGHMPPKIAESQPWEHSCVDMIGPYQTQRKGKKTSRLQAIAMIDPATGWFEIVQSETKRQLTLLLRASLTGECLLRALSKKLF
jgi:hypothetical protein